jgi:hypothetical protein
MTGEGIFAEQIALMFKVSCGTAGIGGRTTLSCKSFRRSTTGYLLSLGKQLSEELPVNFLLEGNGDGTFVNTAPQSGR